MSSDSAESPARSRPQACGRGSEHRVDQPHEEHDADGLAAHREEGGDGRRTALVDVRDPDVEGHGADLEAEADDDEEQAELERGGHRARVVDRCAHRGEVEVAGRAVDPGDAVDEEGRGERADDHELDAGLDRARQAGPPGRHEEERDRDQLEADEERDEVVDRREQAHAQRREHEQRRELGAARRGGGARRVPRGPARRAPWSGRSA
jgi:hypothetical protein